MWCLWRKILCFSKLTQSKCLPENPKFWTLWWYEIVTKTVWNFGGEPNFCRILGTVCTFLLLFLFILQLAKWSKNVNFCSRGKNFLGLKDLKGQNTFWLLYGTKEANLVRYSILVDFFFWSCLVISMSTICNLCLHFSFYICRYMCFPIKLWGSWVVAEASECSFSTSTRLRLGHLCRWLEETIW